MRIVIDMQGAQTNSRFRGIGRYTLSLAQAIVRNRGEHEVILVLSGLFPDAIEPIRAAFDDLLPQENIRVWHAPGPVSEYQPGNEWCHQVAERIREAFLFSLRPDVVHVSSLFEGYSDDAVTSIGVFTQQIPTVVTLYDLIPLLNPETYLKPNLTYALYYQRKIESLKRANLWLAISESAANEGHAALALPVEAVVNISTACDAIFQSLKISENEKQQLLTRFGITQSFILYSGGADARKNLHRLIRSYAGLPKLLSDAHQLVLAGRLSKDEMTKLRQTAKSADIREDQLLFTGYITDKELAQFYKLCAVFVLPSLHEGFGLPALEAMSCGAAVIGANTTSVPEVIGRQDALFDPYDEAAISQKLAQVLSDVTFRSELAAHGLIQARKFSWDESAQRAVAAFEKLHSVKNDKSMPSESGNILPDLVRAIATIVPSNIPNTEILKLAYALSHIHTDDAPKHLFVDISELMQRDAITGVTQAIYSLLKELLEAPPEGYVVEPIYATMDTPGYRCARRFSPILYDGSSNPVDEPINYRPGDIFLGLNSQQRIVASQKEYLASLHRDGVTVFSVVYDMPPLLISSTFKADSDSDHKSQLETLSSFDGAVCISRAVADELTEWLQVHGPKRSRPFKVGWFHLGADIENSVSTRGVGDDDKNALHELTRRLTFLLVGTVESRKGQTQTLDAFELLWKQGGDANLVVVGTQGRMVNELAERLHTHPELGNRLFWLKEISDEYLKKVYTMSSCLIAASEGEGFGLPLIEAAQHKLAIIARDIPVFREVAGEHAHYFRGMAPDDLAQSIKKWMQLYDTDQHPKSDNIPWLTWKQSAQSLLLQILPSEIGSI